MIEKEKYFLYSNLPKVLFKEFDQNSFIVPRLTKKADFDTRFTYVHVFYKQNNLYKFHETINLMSYIV